MRRYDRPWCFYSYLDDAGLNGKNILDIAFDAHGIVWVAASDGLYRYDGYHWKRFTQKESLPSDFVRCVLVSRKGELWVGTDHGVGVFDPDTQTFSPEGTDIYLKNSSVRTIQEDPDGALWFCSNNWPQLGTSGGLASCKDGVWTTYGKKDGIPSDYIMDVFLDSQGERFVLTKKGIVQWNGSAWIQPLKEAGFSDTDHQFWSMAESQEGDLLVSASDQFWLRHLGQWSQLSHPGWTRKSRFCRTRDGEILICANLDRVRDAIFRWNGVRFERITSPLPLHDNPYLTVLREAPDHSLYVLGFDFLVRWTRDQNPWTEFENLSSPQFIDAQNRIWFFSPGETRAVCLDDQQWYPQEGLLGNELQTGDGTIWSWSSQTIKRWFDREEQTWDISEIGLSVLQKVVSGKGHQLWGMGVDSENHHQIITWNGQSWNRFPVPAIDSVKIFEMYSDPQGGVCFAVNSLRDNRIHLLHIQENFVQTQDPPCDLESYIPSFYLDSSGEVWMYGGFGLSRCSDHASPNWQRIEELPGNDVLCLLEGDGGVWVGTCGQSGGQDGIACVSGTPLRSYPYPLSGFAARLQDGSIVFQSGDRLLLFSPQTHGVPCFLKMPIMGKVESVVKDHAERLWIGINNRVLCYQPDGIPPDTEVYCDSLQVIQGEWLSIRMKEVEYGLPSQSNWESFFTWRFDSGAWSSFQPAPVQGFNTQSMEPGRHVLEIRSRDEGLDVDVTPARIAFTVLPTPIQNRPWFIPSVVAFGSAIFFLGVSSLVMAAMTASSKRKLAFYTNQLEDRVQVRTRELHRSESLYHSLVENLPQSIFQKDQDGRFTFVNTHFCEYVGLEKNQILGKTDFELFPKQFAEKYRADDCAVMETGQVYDDIEQGFSEDKQDFWFHLLKTPVWNAENQVVGVQGIFWDITARKIAEDALRESQELVNKAQKVASLGFWTTNLKTGTLSWSSEVFHIFGIPASEFTGRRDMFFQFIHPEDRSKVLDAVAEAMMTCQTYKIQHRITRLDGSIRWLFQQADVICDSNGVPAELVGTVRDVTEKKYTENELLKSQEMLLLVINNVPHIIFWKNPDSVYMGCNEYFLRVFGFESMGGVLGKTDQDMPWDGDTVDWIRKVDRIVMDHDTPRLNIIEFRKITDGREMWLKTNKIPMHDSEGHVVGILCTYEDITERVHMENEKQRLEDQLRQAQKMESIGRLAGGLAHDFNNLLTVIMGHSELLKLSVEKNSPQGNHVHEICASTERAAALTNKLLAFSRKQVIQPKIVNLNTVVNSMGQMLRRLIGEDVELVIQLASDLGMVKADPGQLEQLIINLAVNARDAMPQGGHLVLETGNVELEEIFVREHLGAEPGFFILLSIRDTGCGMSEEIQSKIFEPFFTTKDPGKGTGLGLSSVYGIIKQNKGIIMVESRIDEGTCFRIYLPRVENQIEDQLPAHADKIPLKGKETILLVEDETMVRHLTQDCLRQYSYTVLEARDGEEALRIAAEYPEPIHLLVTDVIMPQMSGIQLSEKMALIRPDIKILYISGYSDDSFLGWNSMDLGSNFLSKPFTPEAFLRQIRFVLHAPVA